MLQRTRRRAAAAYAAKSKGEDMTFERTRKPVVGYAVALVLIALPAGACTYVSGGSSGNFVPLTTVHESVELSGDVARLTAATSVGDITLIGEEAGSTASIQADVKIRRGRYKAEMDKGQFSDHVRVVTEGDRLTIADAHRDQPDHEDWSVTLQIRVPRGLATEVSTGVGDAKVQGFQANARVNAGVGDVQVEGPNMRDIHAESGVGDVLVNGAEAGEVSAESGVGDVTIRLKTAPGKVRAESGTGSVKVVLQAAPKADLSAGTGTGDVDLTLPKGAAGMYDLSTGVGSVDIEGFSGIELKRSYVGGHARGRVGEGGPRIEASSGTGSISLKSAS